MKKQIKIKGLYVIVDPSMCKKNSILETTDAILSGGANIIQYRDKNNPITKQIEIARKIKKLCEKYSTFFIINDNPELALITNSHGLHIGQEDIPISLAKTILNHNQIIGTSNNNLNQVLELINVLRPEISYLTHISHNMGFHDEVSKKLPENL